MLFSKIADENRKKKKLIKNLSVNHKIQPETEEETLTKTTRQSGIIQGETLLPLKTIFQFSHTHPDGRGCNTPSPTPLFEYIYRVWRDNFHT